MTRPDARNARNACMQSKINPFALRPLTLCAIRQSDICTYVVGISCWPHFLCGAAPYFENVDSSWENFEGGWVSC